MKKILLILTCIAGAIMVKAQNDPPPPPPPPPAPPKVVRSPVPPVVIVKGAKADEFYKRNPSVAGISRQGEIITVKMKDESTERYDLGKEEEESNFARKYGACPVPPPPPPPPPAPPKARKVI